MKIVMIRHGMTAGNRKRCFIGSTDEDVCEEGRKKILAMQQAGLYPACEILFVSPMKRCLTTAGMIYPHQAYWTEPDLRECDFGLFEGKNHLELSEREEYRQWVSRGDTGVFPEGEAIASFKKRSVDAFLRCLRKAEQEKKTSAAFVVHGGTIMAVLEVLGEGQGNFYDFHVGNGEGYVMELQSGPEGEKLSVMEKIENNIEE